MNASIEDALALTDPVDVGRALIQACRGEVRDADEIPFEVRTAECAQWLRFATKGLSFPKWRKLAQGLVAYTDAVCAQSNEVRSMITPFLIAYERDRQPGYLVREIYQLAAAARAAERAATEKVIGALLEDLNSGRFAPPRLGLRVDTASTGGRN